MGDFISVQCSEWACSCTKCLSGVKKKLGMKMSLWDIYKSIPILPCYWIKVSLIDSCWKGIHIISTPIEDAQLDKVEALETISK
jgi:hypothetical protein